MSGFMEPIDPGFGPEGSPELGPATDANPQSEIAPEIASDASPVPTVDVEIATDVGNFALSQTADLDASKMGGNVVRSSAISLFWEAVQQKKNLELMDRLKVNPYPSPEEIAMGAFAEEIDPQVRSAVFTMRDKGYNAIRAGFTTNTSAEQSVSFATALPFSLQARIRGLGFEVTADSIQFQPEEPTDLVGMQQAWDLLANELPDLGEPAQPNPIGNAKSFQKAAEEGTLMDFFMPNGYFDSLGTKYAVSRDLLAEFRLFYSEDPVSALRETVFIDQYQALKERLDTNPIPTEEEHNLGAYVEELEPQVRAAVMVMRRKGYNTGSSGFWGIKHDRQVMDIATPISPDARARLAEHMIEVDGASISFKPEHPTNIDRMKQTWDMIADILPDLGKHAEPAQNVSADVFRHLAANDRHNEFLELWPYQAGALNGHTAPLTLTLVREGRSFGSDVYAAQTAAAARHAELVQEAADDSSLR